MKVGTFGATIAIIGAVVASAGSAAAQIIAGNVLAGVSNADDRRALGNISISDDQITIPPLHGQYTMTVRGYAAGNGGGDESTASLTLYVNDGRVAYRADSKFNSYSLDARYTMVSSTTNPTRVRIEHVNDRARETSYGLEIVEIRPF